jgi:hypothetical protein
MEIINLHKKPNEALITALEDLLDRAKKGDLISLAGAGICNDDSVLTFKVYDKRPSLFTLLGAITNLQIVISDDIE